MHGSAPTKTPVSRESPRPRTLSPNPPLSRNAAFCRAPDFGPEGEKARKRDRANRKLDQKTYEICARLSDDLWPLGIVPHAETGYTRDGETRSPLSDPAPFRCRRMLSAGAEGGSPHLFPGHQRGPSRTRALLKVLQPKSPNVVRLLRAC